MTEPRVFIMLPVHNRKALTVAFVRALAEQPYGSLTLILIDDGSTDGTADAVREIGLDLQIIRGDGNLWWGGALQKGFDYLAKLPVRPDDIVLICNDDVGIGPEFISAGVHLLQSRPGSLLLAQCRPSVTGAPEESGVTFDPKSKRLFQVARSPIEINCLSTRGLFFLWSTVQVVGGFRPFLLPHYGSDYEWTMRAHRKGFHLWTDPSLSLVPRLDTTGLRGQEKEMTLSRAWQQLTSLRSTGNVLRWTILLCLIAPVTDLPRLLLRLWWRSMRLVSVTALRSVLRLGRDKGKTGA